jgi:hypothetical protein
MKLNMTVDEALNFADTWSRGMTYHEDSKGWRIVCMLLADEVRRLRASAVSTDPELSNPPASRQEPKA